MTHVRKAPGALVASPSASGCAMGTKEQIQALFRQFDVSKGGVTRSELKGILVDVGSRITESALEAFLDDVMAGRGERISSGSLLDYVYGESRDTATSEAALRHVYQDFDKEGAGGISIASFAEVLKRGAHVVVDGMPVLSILTAMFDRNENSLLEFSEFCSMAQALEKGEVMGVPPTCVVKLAAQLQDVGSTVVFPESPEDLLSNDPAILRVAFDIFDKKGAGLIPYAEFADLVKVAAHAFVDDLPVASTISSLFDANENSRLEFEEFRKMASTLACGGVPGLPRMNVTELSPPTSPLH